jgi:hypothetical protein
VRAWADTFSVVVVEGFVHLRASRMLRRAAVCVVLTITASAGAQGNVPGAAPLARAREVWDRGEFDKAEPFYREAITKGGLGLVDVADCYIHIGAARTVMARGYTKKQRPALEAFRQAALIDPDFVTPSEAGKKAALLAARARRDVAKRGLGRYAIDGSAPERVPANKPFGVDATLSAQNAARVQKVGLVVIDMTKDDHEYRAYEDAHIAVHFDVPADIAESNANLTVRFDALDLHDNRLASVERPVRVDAAPAPPPPPIVAAKPVLPPKREEPKREGEKSGGGFWSTAWPYVIGGVALAAGGAAVYFTTRPSDDVNVGAARVTTR